MFVFLYAFYRSVRMRPDRFSCAYKISDMQGVIRAPNRLFLREREIWSQWAVNISFEYDKENDLHQTSTTPTSIAEKVSFARKVDVSLFLSQKSHSISALASMYSFLSFLFCFIAFSIFSKIVLSISKVREKNLRSLRTQVISFHLFKFTDSLGISNVL